MPGAVHRKSADTDSSLQRELAAMWYGRPQKNHRGRWLQLMKASIDWAEWPFPQDPRNSTLSDNTARMLLHPPPHWVAHSPSVPRDVSIGLTIESHAVWLAAWPLLSQEAWSPVQSHLSSCKLLTHSMKNGLWKSHSRVYEILLDGGFYNETSLLIMLSTEAVSQYGTFRLENMCIYMS